MKSDTQRPLIVIFGSYETIGKRKCLEKLFEIIMVAKCDTRIAHIRKDIVGNLDFSGEPEHDSTLYEDWVKTKSNYYLLHSNFNAIFILQGCDNSTPWYEAEFALENGLNDKTLILLEMSKNNGENSAGSLYAKSTLKDKFKNPPIDYIKYEDFTTAWRKIMGKYLSLNLEEQL